MAMFWFFSSIFDDYDSLVTNMHNTKIKLLKEWRQRHLHDLLYYFHNYDKNV